MFISVALFDGKIWGVAVRFELVQTLHFQLEILDLLFLFVPELPYFPRFGLPVRIVDRLCFAATLFLEVVLMGSSGERELNLPFAV